MQKNTLANCHWEYSVAWRAKASLKYFAQISLRIFHQIGLFYFGLIKVLLILRELSNYYIIKIKNCLKISHISNKKQHVDNWKEYLAIRTILWAEEQLLFHIKSKSAKENLVPGFPAADRCLWTKRFIDGGRKGRKMVILIMWLCCVLDHS